MRAKKNKSLKVILILIACLAALGGAFCAVYFSIDRDYIKYYNVSLNSNSGAVKLSSNCKKLSPNENILDKNSTVMVSLGAKSENSYIRAKIVFENNSQDDRVLSFVSQLNYMVKSIDTFSKDGEYFWRYYSDDNAFYLLENENNLKLAKAGDTFSFLTELVVPADISQISTLNSAGENVQIGQDIEIKISFECVQSAFVTQNRDIATFREYFNLLSKNVEGDFVSENGYITKCTSTDETIVLPKYVGNDYIIGIKEGAFSSTNIKQIIVPANYIYFKENAFSNLTSLNFVAIKNQMNFDLASTTFASSGILEIYLTKDGLDIANEKYLTYSYNSNFKQMTEVVQTDTTQIPQGSTYLYAPSVEEFSGNFKNFTALKVVDFPSLKKINQEMFMGLSSLVCVNCPNATVVENKAFSGCVNVVDVVLENLTSIGENAFLNCSKLASANFASKLDSISFQAFRGCSKLKTINLESENLEIGNNAFYECSTLRNVTIKKLKSLGDYAFGGCNQIRWFIILDCSSLSVGNSVFNKTSGEGDNSNMLFLFSSSLNENLFIDKFPEFSTKTVVAKISNKELTTFDGNVKNLNILELASLGEIEKIGKNCFRNNENVASITIPYFVKKISENAFYGTKNLTKIIINSYSIIDFDENAFNETNESLTIYVPSGLVEVYRQTYENLTFIAN